MFEFVTDYFKTWSTHMDLVGQRRAEHLFQAVIVAHGVVGFCVGFVAQQLSFAVYILGLGFVVACLLVLPPWPCFRRHPLQWQKASSSTDKALNKADKAGPKKKKLRTE